MKVNALTIVSAFLFMFLFATAESAVAQLDFSKDPHFGTVRLASGFTPDPKTVRVVSGGSVAVATLKLCSACSGFASSAPDVKLYWTGDDSDLVIYFEADDSSDDATLVINTPSERWVGNDDASDSSLNPMIRLSGQGAGLYDIWVGSYTSGASISGTLTITELSSRRPR